MERLMQYYRILNILSIDIVAGSIVSALFFARLFNVTILRYGLAALGLTVFIIYTADHLRDARNIRKKALSARHQFHQRYFKELVVILTIAVIANLIVITFIREQVLEWGLLLIAIVIVYLTIQRRFYFLKEFFVAALYTCGVLLPSLSVTKVPLTLFHWGIIIQFGVLALMNLLVFSWFDIDRDIQDDQRSFATRFGKEFTWKFIWMLAGVFLLMSVLLMMSSNFSVRSIIILLMGFSLLVILVKWKFFSKEEYYRLAGDAVFFIPVVTLL